MSTFNGIVAEFPDIRVDYFRSRQGAPPPLACFLTHIHSDHLTGLDTLKSPFVYCSAATKEMLLRLEKYSYRINYARGILEARKQTYKHLKRVLKPIPLETPTTLELEPSNHIQVTLFDANHCPGSVMFLFEASGIAVLYTGDVRCEPWFVNSLIRKPSMIEYSSGLNTLDMIYLDTSSIEDVHYQTKSEGLRELLQKVKGYPPSTIFHLHAWTFGYEDVWIALSKALGSRIHVEDYKMRLYKSLKVKDPENRYGCQFHLTPEAPGLVGFMCGNTEHHGCLTLDENVRLHGCERGNYCETVKNSPVVWIQPIVAHLSNGTDLVEVGAGGRSDDTDGEDAVENLSAGEMQMVLQTMCEDTEIPADLKEEIRSFMLDSWINWRNLSLDLDFSSTDKKKETNVAEALRSMANKTRTGNVEPRAEPRTTTEPLPNHITFPYARHASYPELCHMVGALRPKDVWPCTVSVTEWLHNNTTIRGLFGRYCSGDLFQHDIALARINAEGRSASNDRDTWTTVSPEVMPTSEKWSGAAPAVPPFDETTSQLNNDPRSRKRGFEECQASDGLASQHPDDEFLVDSQASTVSRTALEIRRAASSAILSNAVNDDCIPIGLVSTTDNHSRQEGDLGSH